MTFRPLLTLALSTGLAALTGCEPATKPPAAPAASAAAKDDHGHDHGPGGHTHGHGAGPHGGTLADWGGGKYHIEFTVDHDKKEAVVYVLGGDEKTPAPVKTADGSLLLTITEPAFQVTLKASPLEGEKEGASSRYVGQHDSLGIVREFAGSVSGEVDGTPYAGDFKEEPHGGHDHK